MGWVEKFRNSALIATVALPFSFAATMAPARGSAAIHPNYRHLVAAKLRQMVGVSTIRSPQISGPQERWVGVFLGGMRPTICVRLIKLNLLGMSGTYFTCSTSTTVESMVFSRARSISYNNPMIGCDNKPLTPFTELRSR